MEIDIKMQSVIIYSLTLSIRESEKGLQEAKRICPDQIEYWQRELAYFQEAKEKMLNF